MKTIRVLFLTNALAMSVGGDLAAQNPPALPPIPQPPSLNSPHSAFKTWYGEWFTYLVDTGKLLLAPADSYTLQGDWLLHKKQNNGNAIGMQVSTTSSADPVLELMNYVWANNAGPSDTTIILEALAHEVWNTTVAQSNHVGGDVEWEFHYLGSPWHKGIVELEAWYQYLGYARAHNDECGVYCANGGRYHDDVGEDLIWRLSVAAQTSTNTLPASITLAPSGGGPQISINLSTSSDGFEMKFNTRHRPKKQKVVTGEPGNPGVITIIKEAETETHGELNCFAFWAGPGTSQMAFWCWFKGRFFDVAS